MNLTLFDEVMLLRAQVDYLLERLAGNPVSDSGGCRPDCTESVRAILRYSG